MRKPTRRSLVTKLDTLTSLIIRKKTPYCVQQGDGRCNGQLTNGHVLAGRFHALRWDIRPNGNCHTQCWGHNYLHSKHQNFYHDWYRAEFGELRWKFLQSEYYGNQGHFTDKKLKEMIEEYAKLFKDLT